MLFFFFFFNDTATTEIYTLSLHDALPIWGSRRARCAGTGRCCWRSYAPCRALADRRCAHHAPGHRPLPRGPYGAPSVPADRKSTRLNSSHSQISYAVFCLKKKKTAPCSAPKLNHMNFELAPVTLPMRFTINIHTQPLSINSLPVLSSPTRL